MEITLKKTTHKTITCRGKDIRVITKTKFPKPAENVVVPASCSATEQRTWHDTHTKDSIEYDYESFSKYMAEQMAHFNKSGRTRGNRGKKK